MAKISSELATLAVGNKYDLVLIASRRARELARGWNPTVATTHGTVVTALKEIEEGKIGRDYLLKQPNIDRREKPPQEDR